MSALINMRRGFTASLFFVLIMLFAACSQDESRSVFEAGEKLRGEGRHEEAIDRYRFIVLHAGKSKYAPEALFRIGELSYFDLGDFDSAVDAFRRLLDRYSWSNRSAEAQKYLADIYMNKLEDYKQAIIEYQRAISYYNASIESESFQLEIAKAYFNLRDFEQQRVELALLLERYPDTELRAEVYFQTASSYFVQGMPDEALDEYRRIISEFPDTPIALEATFQTAVCLEEKERLKEAIGILEDIEGVYPNPGVIRMRIERIGKRLKKRRRG